MEEKKCPDCRALLIEDAAEELEIDQNGSVTIGGFLAYVCSAKCGYVERMPDGEEYPQVIADRGDALLLLYPNDQGRVYIKADNVLYPPMHYEAILKFGYWNEYKGEEAGVLIDRYAEKPDEPKSLFEFATSELSQDAFLSWLVQWADPKLKTTDEALHKTALLFLERIFQKHKKPLPNIESVEIIKQFKGLDILIVLNGNTAILIEDKTYTSDHSNQLIRYRKAVEKKYPNHLQLPIYYKSASQSHYRSCEKAGYSPFLREDMIDIMNRGKEWGVCSDIFLDYLKRLEQIEAGYQSYQWLPVQNWKASSWQGFFRLLQTELSNGDWGYVANASGGFQGFWWLRNPNKACYFQIEQLRLCIKIVELDKYKQREARVKAAEHLFSQQAVQTFSFQKPIKSGTGQTMTVMMKNDYIQLDQEGLLNVQATVDMLKKIEKEIFFL